MKKHKTRQKRRSWFVATRGSYLPVSTKGWLTYIPFVAYLIFTLMAGVKETNSLVAAVLFIVPNWVAATVVMTYIAARKS